MAEKSARRWEPCFDQPHEHAIGTPAELASMCCAIAIDVVYRKELPEMFAAAGANVTVGIQDPRSESLMWPLTWRSRPFVRAEPIESPGAVAVVTEQPESFRKAMFDQPSVDRLTPTPELSPMAGTFAVDVVETEKFSSRFSATCTCVTVVCQHERSPTTSYASTMFTIPLHVAVTPLALSRLALADLAIWAETVGAAPVFVEKRKIKEDLTVAAFPHALLVSTSLAGMTTIGTGMVLHILTNYHRWCNSGLADAFSRG